MRQRQASSEAGVAGTPASYGCRITSYVSASELCRYVIERSLALQVCTRSVRRRPHLTGKWRCVRGGRDAFTADAPPAPAVSRTAPRRTALHRRRPVPSYNTACASGRVLVVVDADGDRWRCRCFLLLLLLMLPPTLNTDGRYEQSHPQTGPFRICVAC